jgi:hypothetical protein
MTSYIDLRSLMLPKRVTVLHSPRCVRKTTLVNPLHAYEFKGGPHKIATYSPCFNKFSVSSEAGK